MYAKAVTLVFAVTACSIGEPPKKASATLEARSGSTLNGTAEFVGTGDHVKLTLSVNGATPGRHGVHLHDVGDCSAPDATSAMGHWNPDMSMHGGPNTGNHHVGDCGNLEIGPDGTGTLTIYSPWSIGTGAMNDVVGHAIIVHATLDDFTTQTPPGNAGARAACGVITLAP